MKNLILASQSPQRKNLLKSLGLKFRIVSSQAEELHVITSTCSALVKHNALLKAEDVASRFKKGVIIGADSLVYLGKRKIIGKPRTLKEAKQILRTLTRQPHWVYTGVAVIDVATGKRVIDYEKTKIFMNPLTDQEIDRYHKCISPLDKAGGFDIEGFGGMFIRRVEGCYFNVIGLPLAKLRQMLKQVDVEIL